MIIYRIISAFVTIFIVAPLWIAMCVIMLLHSLTNRMLYHNFINQEELVHTDSIFINKFSSLMGKSIAEFIYYISQLKTIKF
jgi:hypothetical protein